MVKGLTRMADCLERMVEEARMDRTILIDILKSINSMDSKNNTWMYLPFDGDVYGGRYN